MEYGIYMLAYLVSYVFSLADLKFFSGGVLIFTAIYLYAHWYRETGNLSDLRGLFTLSWVGGQGIACLQLSRLQSDWHYLTWLCFFLVYLAFGIGYEWGLKDGRVDKHVVHEDRIAERVMTCINALGLLSLSAFIVEVIIRRYVPLFSNKPHAYSFFSVTGIHYFTVSCVLLPALSILFIKMKGKLSAKEKRLLIVWNLVALAIPILIVSRFQIVFSVGFALSVYIITNKSIRVRTLFLIIVFLVPLYVLLSIARNHDVAYLNGIFEMKNAQMPIFITQPYMYVANNYENFNFMVESLTSHTFGLRMLFPVIALTGLKFVAPELVSMPVFLTKPELTTLTMFYDAYYDFGVFGVFVFALLVGVLAKAIIIRVRQTDNPIIFIFYGQLALYLALSFFTTWFSNPTTWFWFVLTGVIYWYVGKVQKKNDE